MSDERSFLHFWGSCGDHFDQSLDDSESLNKQGDEVDRILELLQTGQPFSSDKYGLGVTSDPLSPQDSEKPSLQDPVPEPQPVQPAPQTPATPSAPSAAPAPPVQSTQPPPTLKPTVKNKTSSNSGGSKSLKHKCDTCSQVFDSKIALSIHTGRIHKHEGRDKNYQCTHCSKAFYNSSYLAQHMRIHTGLKPYPCPDCDKRFTQLSHLQQHKRTHTGEKPYKCTQPGCTKAFSQLSNLQSHSRSHLPDGNVHKCTSCYKCYFDEASLNAHLRTHMVNKRVRNYRCDECGKSYTQDTYLQNHIKNKHGGASIDPIGMAGPSPKQAMGGPTSIQAISSIFCKQEEPNSLSCESQPTSQLAQSHLQSLQPKLLSSGSLLGQLGYQQDTPSYDLQRIMPPAFNTNPTESRSVYDGSSAFKPVIRSVAYDGLDCVSSGQGDARRLPNRLYEPQSSLTEILPALNPIDVKNNIDSETQESEVCWRLGNNSASLGGYPSLPSQIQSYVASQSNYQPYTSYMSAPLDSFLSDKANLYNGDAMSDYLMGGLRDTYHME